MLITSILNTEVMLSIVNTEELNSMVPSALKLFFNSCSLPMLPYPVQASQRRYSQPISVSASSPLKHLHWNPSSLSLTVLCKPQQNRAEGLLHPSVPLLLYSSRLH